MCSTIKSPDQPFEPCIGTSCFSTKLPAEYVAWKNPTKIKKVWSWLLRLVVLVRRYLKQQHAWSFIMALKSLGINTYILQQIEKCLDSRKKWSKNSWGVILVDNKLPENVWKGLFAKRPQCKLLIFWSKTYESTSSKRQQLHWLIKHACTFKSKEDFHPQSLYHSTI